MLCAALLSFVLSSDSRCVPFCTKFADAALVDGTLHTVPCGECISVRSGTRARLAGLQVDGVLRVEENVTLSTHYVIVRAAPGPESPSPAQIVLPQSSQPLLV